MWIATWALNTLVAKGKTTDWMVHMIGQSIGAYTDATHGMTLSAVSLAYYRHIMPYGLDKFKRFAINVWNVNPENKTDEEIADEGLKEMEKWMNKIGLVMNIKELGVTEDMLDGIADGSFIMTGGYKTLDHDEIVDILKELMAKDGIRIRGVYERSDAKVREQEGMERRKGFIGEPFDTKVEICLLYTSPSPRD